MQSSAIRGGWTRAQCRRRSRPRRQRRQRGAPHADARRRAAGHVPRRGRVERCPAAPAERAAQAWRRAGLCAVCKTRVAGESGTGEFGDGLAGGTATTEPVLGKGPDALVRVSLLPRPKPWPASWRRLGGAWHKCKPSATACSRRSEMPHGRTESTSTRSRSRVRVAHGDAGHSTRRR